jgi:4-hydroxy-3-polyprenylbenzoate decarboxylase
MLVKKRVLVCITGASGSIYGVRLVRTLKRLGQEVHLIVSEWGATTLKHEMDMTVEELEAEVDQAYDENDLSAGPSSGSFHLDAMAVVPCSMKTLSGIAHGYSDNLVTRAADCSLKERRHLVLVPRETPLTLIHIRNMELVTQAGAVVLPASPAFWHKPDAIEELVDSLVDRILVHIGILPQTTLEWKGYSATEEH